ncbi:Hypothetical predicted protein, partial [Drosophila guanche]
ASSSNFLQQLQPNQQRRHSSYQQQARYYSNSISDDSLNRSRRESFACMRAASPPVRRLSASCLQEELCAQGHQLHIDPRYRDTRPIARSASSLYLANDQGYFHPIPSAAAAAAHFSPMRPLRRTPPPSIFIEEYLDEPPQEVPPPVEPCQVSCTSQESFGHFAAYSDTHQPLNEDGIASMAHSDDIPFIDDEEEQQQMPPICIPAVAPCPSFTVKRTPVAGYRKTVSFDLEQPPTTGQAAGAGAGVAAAAALGIDRKYHTHDAISHFAASTSSTESLMAEQAERMPLIQKIRRELNSKRATNCTADGFSSGGSGSNSQRSSSESIERMPLLRQQSPLHRQLNTQRSHKRSGLCPSTSSSSVTVSVPVSAVAAAPPPPIISIKVPNLCETESSCTRSRSRSPPVNTSNRYCASTIRTSTTSASASASAKANLPPPPPIIRRRRASSQINLSPNFQLPLGQGKVREMAAYFNANQNFPPSMARSKSKSTSALAAPSSPSSSTSAKLSHCEQGQILKQLKEWSLYGSAGKDYDVPVPEPVPVPAVEPVKTSCDCPCCGHCRDGIQPQEEQKEKQLSGNAGSTFKCYDSCRDEDVEASSRKQASELSRLASCRRSVMCSNRQVHSLRQLKRNKQQRQEHKQEHLKHKAKQDSASHRHRHRHHNHHCHHQQTRLKAPVSPPSTAKLLLSLASSSGSSKSASNQVNKSWPNCENASDDYPNSCSCSCSEAESCCSAADSTSGCCPHCNVREMHVNVNVNAAPLDDNDDEDEDDDEDGYVDGHDDEEGALSASASGHCVGLRLGPSTAATAVSICSTHR